MEREYSEDRLYWASVKRFTLMLEDDMTDLDPKIVSEIVKFLDNAEIRPASIEGADDDPAVKRARELAANKK